MRNWILGNWLHKHLLFYLQIGKMSHNKTIFGLSLGFDPQPKIGWENNTKMVSGFSLRLSNGKLILEV